MSRERSRRPDRQTVALFDRSFHIVVFEDLSVSLITAPKRLNAETPRSGFSSADRSLAKPLKWFHKKKFFRSLSGCGLASLSIARNWHHQFRRKRHSE